MSPALVIPREVAESMAFMIRPQPGTEKVQ